MARGRDLPPALATVLPGRRTPFIAALGALALAAILLPLGEIAVVASLSSLGSLVAFGAVNLSLVVLRAREPSRRRPFRVPLSVGRIPLLPVAGVLVIGVLLVQFEPLVYLIGGVVVVAVLVLGRARGLWAKGDR
jgi:APA family basic amino acid/polyamine antiporter